jgi:acyl-CoA thioesterase
VGPNGGYVAALFVRAIEAEVADPTRPLRSLTIHYLRPPSVEAEAELIVAIERTGRSFTSATARLVQDGRTCAIAIAALAQALPTALDYATPMPDVLPPEEIEPLPTPDTAPPMARHFEIRYALGSRPFSQAEEALTGGWIRLREPQPVDAALLALYVDAWVPVAWSRLDAFVPAPTVDLTIHFRAPDVARTLDSEVSLLTRFSSTTSHDGLFEEDGQVWAPDGTLLAQGRQLALLRPRRTEAS